ncbi:MAG: NAD(P)-dependent oxidoreductase [Betaproteobacteria bacterium]|nr:NAD(P)-dependent oxidoreductase [Betaproteobacteria bacterium]
MTQKTYDACTPQRLAFLGLGVMGFHMAGHLSQAGHHVTVYNRNSAKANAWLEQFKGEAAATPREAASQADIVFCCVGNDDDLRAVSLGADGAFAGMRKGSYFVDNTTASAQVARDLYQQAKSIAVGFLDAPVSGGEAGAKNGVLTVMVGGDQADSGAGQLAKMVNQICIAGLVQGLSEGINFGMQSGLDMKLVLDVISKGAAQSWQMENRGKTMVDDQFNFGFAVDWMRKDLSLCLDEARRNGAPLPVIALVDQFYRDVQRMGGGRFDTSSLIKRLRDSH